MDGHWEVEMVRPEGRFGWAVRIYRALEPGTYQVMVYQDGLWEIVTASANAEAPYTLLLPDEVMYLLAKGMNMVKDYSPEPTALETHLQDAVKVRDRLLSLVEQNQTPHLLPMQTARLHDE